jgi:hypothetical protein
MSAFVVSKKHIDTLVSAYAAMARGNRWESMSQEECDKVGQTLWDENVRSVNFCYQERSRMPEYTWTPVTVPSVAQVLKACHCLEYQSCERPDWQKSLACQYLREICGHYETQVKGYAEADWEIK